jgi:hypothetical protein
MTCTVKQEFYIYYKQVHIKPPGPIKAILGIVAFIQKYRYLRGQFEPIKQVESHQSKPTNSWHDMYSQTRILYILQAGPYFDLLGPEG